MTWILYASKNNGFIYKETKLIEIVCNVFREGIEFSFKKGIDMLVNK